MAYMLIFLLKKKIWVFFSKNTCESAIALTRTVNILTTNELIKLTMLWTTGPCLVVSHESKLYHFNERIIMRCHNISINGLIRKMSQRTTKPTLRLVRPDSDQSAHPCDSDQSLLIACAFYSIWAIQRGIKENPCHTWWMHKLIWVFAGHTGLIVGFVVRWLKYCFLNLIAVYKRASI